MKISEFKTFVNNFCRKSESIIAEYRKIQSYLIPEVITACCDIEKGYTVQDVIKDIKQEIENEINDIYAIKNNTFKETMNLSFTYGDDLDIDNLPIDEINECLANIQSILLQTQEEFEPIKNYFLYLKNGG